MGKNYFYLTVAELASKIVTFTAIAYLARVVGPTAYGYFEFSVSALFCAGLVIDQGLGSFGAREIAKAPQDSGELVWQIVNLRFLLASIATLGLLFFALAFEHPPLLTVLLVIYAVDLMGMPLLLQWVFQGHDQMGTVALLQLIRQALFASVIFAFVHAPSQVWIVAVAEGAGIAGAVAYGLARYRQQFGRWLGTRLAFAWEVLRESAPIGFSQIFWVVRVYGATLVLGFIAVPSDVGYFGAAMRLFVALHAFIYLYFFNQLPSLTRAWQLRDSGLNALIALSLRRVAWLCLLIVPAWILTAPFVMTTVYGADFLAGAVVFQWLGVVFAMAWLNGHYRFGLIATGWQRAEMQSQLLGSLTAVILIPGLYPLGGSDTVGIALVIAEGVVWITSWAWARSKLNLRGHPAILFHPALGVLLALGLTWAMRGLALLERVFAIEVLLGIWVLALDSDLRTWLFALIRGLRIREHLDRLMRLRST
jgi:PST family polysaccharide transporter